MMVTERGDFERERHGDVGTRRGEDRGPNRRARSDEPDHQLGSGRRRNHIGCLAPHHPADVERRRAELRIDRPLDGADPLQRIEQLIDRRASEFGVPGMRGHSARLDGHAQGALLRGREAIPRWLAIDQDAPLRRQRGCGECPVRTVLLSNHEEQPHPVLSLGREPLRGHDHRGGKALGVTASATKEDPICLVGREVWRHRVEVGGKHHDRLPARGVEVGAIAVERLPLHRPAEVGQQDGDGRHDCPFRSGHRRYADQPRGQLHDIELGHKKIPAGQ
jgi:hypothetical protein